MSAVTAAVNDTISWSHKPRQGLEAEMQKLVVTYLTSIWVSHRCRLELSLCWELNINRCRRVVKTELLTQEALESHCFSSEKVACCGEAWSEYAGFPKPASLYTLKFPFISVIPHIASDWLFPLWSPGRDYRQAYVRAITIDH
jgi:hypothetical protein